MTDIQVDLAGTRVNLRVSALVKCQDQILVCRITTEDWFFLPGGRIKTNESSLEAIQRELSEEIGAGFRILRPVICAENFFILHTVSFHEICIFYEAEWLEDRQVIRPNENEQYTWVAQKDIEQIDLRPAFIKQTILQIPDELQLVIFRDDPIVSPGKHLQ